MPEPRPELAEAQGARVTVEQIIEIARRLKADGFYVLVILPGAFIAP